MKIIKKLFNTPVIISILIIIVTITLISSFCHFDNDIWFILASGKYVLGHGIPHTEVLTMHDSYNLVMQQWLSAVIYYSSYLFLGAKGITIIVSLISLTFLFILYKYSYSFTKNHVITSLLIMVFSIFSLRYFSTSRPQIFTYLILTIELLLSEKFYQTKNFKYLIALPFLSILEINLHSSMWFLQICFVGTFIFNSFKDKKLFFGFAGALLLMGLAGFINPYGLDGITYVFKSYGVSVLNTYINEMHEPSIHDLYSLICFVFLFFVILLNGNSKKKLPIRYWFLLLGTGYLFMSNIKSEVYFHLILVIVMSYLMQNIDLINLFKNITKNKINLKINSKISACCRFIFIVFALMSFFSGFIYSLSISNMGNPMSEAVDYFEQIESSKNVTILCTYEDGGYLEWRGYKPYIDPRGDVFLQRTNGQEELMGEYVSYFEEYNDRYDDMNSLFEKYCFDYVITSKTSDYYKFITTHETNYKLVYNWDKTNGYVIYKRVRK